MAKGERLQGYAPGNYFCTCADCGIEFQGDKRAQQCQVCALRAELAAERDKRERAEAACDEKHEALTLLASHPEETYCGHRVYKYRHLLSPASHDFVQRALSADAGRAYAERCERYTRMVEAIAQDLDTHHADPACDLAWFITRVQSHLEYTPADREALQEDRYE